jgi:hypothetical protein
MQRYVDRCVAFNPEKSWARGRAVSYQGVVPLTKVRMVPLVAPALST